MSQPVTQEEILDRTWDAIVVGSGVGGATSARYLALRGQRVLLIEKGSADLSTKELPLWKNTVRDIDRKKAFHPFLGEGLGGTSRLYGMVMERFEDVDFQDKGGGWPLSLTDWSPYYDKAEEIFQVKPAPIAEGFAPFLRHMQSQGIKPKALQLSFSGRKDCDFCQSRLCSKQCKIDARSGLIDNDLLVNRYSTLVNAEVRKLLFGSNRAYGVEVLINNQIHSVKAKRIFLGLGALQTPYLLKRSKTPKTPNGLGDSRGLLGRFLMRHFVDLYFLDWPGSFELRNHKALGIYDFYRDNELNSTLGVFQSFGSLPPIEYLIAELTNETAWSKIVPGFKQLAKFAIDQIFSKHVMASIVEDDPHFENRLIFSEFEQVQFQYRIFKAEQKKIERSRQIGHQIFSPFLTRVHLSAGDNKRLAHVCGTCKMGESIQDSVVDWNGRLHELENVYVVDSSVFPTSTGKNPSLTIAANAIRIVEKSD